MRITDSHCDALYKKLKLSMSVRRSFVLDLSRSEIADQETSFLFHCQPAHCTKKKKKPTYVWIGQQNCKHQTFLQHPSFHHGGAGVEVYFCILYACQDATTWHAFHCGHSLPNRINSYMGQERLSANSMSQTCWDVQANLEILQYLMTNCFHLCMDSFQLIT